MLRIDRYASSASQRAVRGHAVFDEGCHSMETGARDLGDVLRAWADQVEAGIIPVPQGRLRASVPSRARISWNKSAN